ncbi:hypothetical protein [Stenomitos frigidus]|uniref:hypothetical protein n=1 Tax=Stenomitos frigidus TaxID=1886765 RepID=UPI001C634115|nr:hypothetical protein [Stenomitos frigidus]
MKITEASEPQRDADDLLPEYEFDYLNARPNRFVSKTANSSLTVELEPDVATDIQMLKQSMKRYGS